MAKIVVSRHRADLDVVRTAFNRKGASSGRCGRHDEKVVYEAPGPVEIPRADFDRSFPWLRSQDMPRPWLRLADAARDAGSKVVEHTRDRLVIDDAA